MKDLYAALHTEAATEAQARYWDELTSIAASYNCRRQPEGRKQLKAKTVAEAVAERKSDLAVLDDLLVVVFGEVVPV